MTSNRTSNPVRTIQAVEAAWPDLFVDLQAAYTDLVNTRFELERHTTAMQRANDVLQQVIASMSEALFIVDNTNRVVQVNPAALRLLGANEVDCLRQNPSRFFPDPDIPTSAWKILEQSPQGAVTNYETVIRSRAGHLIPVSLSASVMRDREERITGVLIVTRDITERKRAEAALRRAYDELELRVQQRTAELSAANAALEQEIVERHQAERRFRSLLEAAPDAIVIVNARGEIVLVNTQTEKLFGYQREELLGQPVDRLLPAYLRGRNLLHRATAEEARLAHPLGSGLDLYGLHKAGHEIPIDVSLSPLQTEEGLLITSAIRDVTERKLAEEQLERSREQLRALSSRLQEVREEERASIAREIHDELGQQMTSLKMDTVWLRKHLRRDQGKLLDKIMSMGILIDGTIQSVRRIATELRPALLDDFGLFAAIEWQAKEFQRWSHIGCELALPVEQVSLYPSSATGIFRIFQEALTNVARHAEATRVTVTLQRLDDLLVLQVQDNGKGIPEEKLEGSKSLGLLGMRERVRLLEGELRITGSPGRGTTVLVTVPLAKHEIRTTIE